MVRILRANFQMNGNRSFGMISKTSVRFVIIGVPKSFRISFSRFNSCSFLLSHVISMLSLSDTTRWTRLGHSCSTPISTNFRGIWEPAGTLLRLNSSRRGPHHILSNSQPELPNGPSCHCCRDKPSRSSCPRKTDKENHHSQVQNEVFQNQDELR